MDQDAMVRERLPEPIRHLAGEIMDVDSHEQIPAQLWEQEIGPIARELAALWMDDGQDYRSDRNHPNVPGYTTDAAPISLDTLWKNKGCIAPGAVDIGRRPAVMDMMGVKRQLMFPTAGLHCVHLLTDLAYAEKLERNRSDYARDLIKAYNKWGVEVARKSDRVRPVLPLIADSPAALLRQAQELINDGIRAFWIPSRLPPGGVSPAHPDLDPLWALLAANNAPVCLHITSDSHIFWTDVWREAPAFAGFLTLGEFKVDPWSMVNMHTMSQNMLSTMVLGGVFERHPMLRMGISELGGFWIGPLCDTMDLWFHKSIGSITDRMSLPHEPSYYVKRNVRVSPFDFENVQKYIATYDLEDVFAFASDYPHIEGGFDPINRLYMELAPLGQEVVEKFFVKNGKWLLPD